MEPGGQTVDHDLGQRTRKGDDIGDIEIDLVEHLPIVGVQRADTVFCPCPIESILVEIGDRDQIHARLVIDHAKVVFRVSARPDDGCSQIRHAS
tara:strand:- start:3320 stop:3601 length:282 start_codon:yes stop_codon:yes gene_type:complete